jgi:hypothetical protein
MHSIRLRGPWQLEPVYRYVLRENGEFDACTANLPAPATMKMPADWSAAFGAEFLGRVRYVRTFHAPPGLVPEERVWLVVEPQRSEARVVMGDDTLGVVPAGGDAQRFDITHRLGNSNRLEIFVDHPALVEGKSTVGNPRDLPPGGLVGEVRLEIDE